MANLSIYLQKGLLTDSKQTSQHPIFRTHLDTKLAQALASDSKPEHVVFQLRPD